MIYFKKALLDNNFELQEEFESYTYDHGDTQIVVSIKEKHFKVFHEYREIKEGCITELPIEFQSITRKPFVYSVVSALIGLEMELKKDLDSIFNKYGEYLTKSMSIEYQKQRELAELVFDEKDDFAKVGDIVRFNGSPRKDKYGVYKLVLFDTGGKDEFVIAKNMNEAIDAAGLKNEDVSHSILLGSDDLKKYVGVPSLKVHYVTHSLFFILWTQLSKIPNKPLLLESVSLSDQRVFNDEYTLGCYFRDFVDAFSDKSHVHIDGDTNNSNKLMSIPNQDIFDFFADEHELILIQSQIDDIIEIVKSNLNESFDIEKGLGIKPKVWSKDHTENVKLFIKNFNERKINALNNKIGIIELLDRNDKEFYPYYYMLPQPFKYKVNQLILLCEIYWNSEIKTLTEAIDVCKGETILKSVSNQSSETDGVLVVFETPNCLLTFNYIFDSSSTIGGISLKSAKSNGLVCEIESPRVEYQGQDSEYYGIYLVESEINAYSKKYILANSHEEAKFIFDDSTKVLESQVMPLVELEQYSFGKGGENLSDFVKRIKSSNKRLTGTLQGIVKWFQF